MLHFATISGFSEVKIIEERVAPENSKPVWTRGLSNPISVIPIKFGVKFCNHLVLKRFHFIRFAENLEANETRL